MVYSEDYTINWHDTDANNRVRPSRVLMYMQETGNHQFLFGGKPLGELHDKDHMGFILSRLALSFDRPIRAYEHIRVDTFTTDSHGISFGRCFCVTADGQVAARGISTWALVRTDTHEMVKVNDSPVDFGDEPTLETPVPLRFRIPSGAELTEVGTRKIVYSDLDFNGHMNNTRYPDLLCDFLPDATNVNVKGMSLSFLHEAAYGQTVRVLRAADPEIPGRFWFRTIGADGLPGLEAMVLTEPLSVEGAQ